ncbi:MAG TPA: hypothetical protein VEA78_03330 [Acidimicrobiales bacterium]|nr:hypothetical protein [Acidimicrobiales bacterium]
MRLRREGDDLVVTHLWGFRTRIPRAAIASIEPIEKTGALAGIGVHGWGGHWTVNTRRRPAVRVTLRESVRAWVLFAPVRLETLDLAPATPADLA